MGDSKRVWKLKKKVIDAAVEPDLNDDKDAAYVREYDLVADKFKGEKPTLLFSKTKLASTVNFEGNDYMLIAKALPLEHVDGATAHELGHVVAKDSMIGFKHAQVNFAASSFAGLLFSYLLVESCIKFVQKHSSRVRDFSTKAINAAKITVGTISFAGMYSLFSCGGALVKDSLSVKREARADEYATQIIPAEELVEMMQWRISVTKSNPFTEKVMKKMARTHPSAEDRLEFFKQKAEEQRAEGQKPESVNLFR